MQPEPHGHGLRFTELSAGSVSYVDRGWLTGDEDPVPSLSFAPDGAVSWCGERVGQVTVDTDLTAVAAGALLAVAREAAAAIPKPLRAGIEVIGDGLVAEQVRRQVASQREQPGERPAAVVDTTGDPDAIRSALERVGDLGTVVLAGESAGRRLDLNLYSSVHRRGLVLVGVAPPLHGVDTMAVMDVDDRDLLWCRETLTEVSSESPVPRGSLWYRIVA